jgi:hypothetical protein
MKFAQWLQVACGDGEREKNAPSPVTPSHPQNSGISSVASTLRRVYMREFTYPFPKPPLSVQWKLGHCLVQTSIGSHTDRSGVPP